MHIFICIYIWIYTQVIANGSIVRLTDNSCVMDNVDVDSNDCRGLWYEFRGAGSSFGIVTSLTMKLFRGR